MAPEIVARKEYAGFCADIWAMGVLLYALLCGSFPFRGQNDKDLYRKIVRGVFNIPEFVSDGARAVLNRALTTEMSRRPTVDDLLADLWLVSHKEDAAKAAEGAYKPNISTSSTATTIAPSSSTGQSARESSGESPAALRAPPAPATPFGASVAAPGVSSSVVRSSSADPRSIGDKAPAGSGAAAVASLAAAAAANSQGLQSSSDKRAQLSSAIPCTEECRPAPCDAAGTPAADISAQPCCTGTSTTQEKGGERYGRKVEEEAINKLERLGYPRDEIVRQLNDESSHLCKLYHRFLKALTTWDNNKPKP
jgi:serine/threonine protein kinase